VRCIFGAMGVFCNGGWNDEQAPGGEVSEPRCVSCDFVLPPDWPWLMCDECLEGDAAARRVDERKE
jgi:hypothetical protein